MLDTSTVRALAARLHDAERARTQIRQISLDYPDIDIADAYAIQRAWMEIKLGEGRVKRGHKIGLTSRAMQQASQIQEPDFGMLLDDMFFDDGTDIPAGRFILPRLEVWLAFVLGKRLPRGPDVTLFQVYDAVDYVIPALEIIDARSHGIDPDSKRPARCSTPSPTTRPTRAWSWADAREDRRAGPALDRRHPVAQRRHRGNRRGRGRLESSRQWRSMAGEQAGRPRRGAGSGRDHPVGFLHPAGGGPPRRYLQRRLRRWVPSTATSFEQSVVHGHPEQHLQARAARPNPRSACGQAWRTPTPPRSSRAPASTGC